MARKARAAIPQPAGKTSGLPDLGTAALILPMTDQRHDARYQARGVSAGKGEVHAAISRQELGLFPGAFCKIVPDDLSGSADHCLVMHADGAGTKSSLAYLYWQETGDESVWAGIAQDSLVMNLDDCACVGAMGPYLISNTIGRNAKRVPGSVIKGIVEGYQNLCDTLSGLGIPCVMTGGETADVGDLVRTVIADSTITTRLRRDEVIDAGRISPGDIIVGFSSTGQAAWETVPNAGMGSNGLTSARHELLGGDYRSKHPATYAPEIDPSLIYCGKFKVTDPLPGDPRFTVGKAILSPTRTYLPLLKQLFAAIPRHEISGLIHCSGGGQSKIVKFGKPGNRYVKDALFPVPPLFAALKEHTDQSWAEMHSVYNMGHRLEVTLPERRVADALAVATACGIEAKVVGRVESTGSERREVVVRTAHGEFTYT